MQQKTIPTHQSVHIATLWESSEDWFKERVSGSGTYIKNDKGVCQERAILKGKQQEIESNL